MGWDRNKVARREGQRHEIRERGGARGVWGVFVVVAMMAAGMGCGREGGGAATGPDGATVLTLVRA